MISYWYKHHVDSKRIDFIKRIVLHIFYKQLKPT